MLKIYILYLISLIYCISIDKSKELILESYIPKILQSEIKPKKTSCYIPLEYLDWYPNSITYTLYISEMNEEIWYEDEYLMSNSINSRYTSSKFSEIKLIPLKRVNTEVNIFVQGTGRNNHDNAIVT